jgi:hypothetical protein
VEDYAVNLHGVTVLELRIVPDISKGDARASLIRLRLLHNSIHSRREEDSQPRRGVRKFSRGLVSWGNVMLFFFALGFNILVTRYLLKSRRSEVRP